MFLYGPVEKSVKYKLSGKVKKATAKNTHIKTTSVPHDKEGKTVRELAVHWAQRRNRASNPNREVFRSRSQPWRHQKTTTAEAELGESGPNLAPPKRHYRRNARSKRSRTRRFCSWRRA